MKNIENKIKKIASKDLNLINVLKLFKIFIKLDKEDGIRYIELFIKEYYSLKENMPKEFYEIIINQVHNDKSLSLFNVLIERDVYLLISYLKYNGEDVSLLKDIITPLQYYSTPKKYINHIIEKLEGLVGKSIDGNLNSSIKDEDLWLLKRIPHNNNQEYMIIAYKIYLSIGLDNGLELLDNKYGLVDYEKIHFLFLELNVKDGLSKEYQEKFCNFLFENKRNYNNVIRQILRGEFNELFLNFDYFYNNFNYFIDRLGSKMSKDKVIALIKDRFLTYNPTEPKITGDIVEDMVSSYYCKYNFLDISGDEIKDKNFKIYDEYLRTKYISSIPQIKLDKKEDYMCEIINLDDPRNLVLGYRAGNCFRINGDASVLFHNFLKSEHMRLVSISTLEYKDFAMMLIMRNGNVLIGQGIETSKRIPEILKGKKLYDVCRWILKEMMDYMNQNGDEIVATVIGNSNENVSRYNNQILPFLINPILDNSNGYYNGIYNYQCLMDLKEGKSLNDIRLYVPSKRYLDKRESVLRRYYGKYDSNFREIEQKLSSLRYFRMKKEGNLDFYNTLFEHKEVYTCCNNDFYIILFDDGTIDGFMLDSDDERVKEEYESEYEMILKGQKILKRGWYKYHILRCNKKSKILLK